jgi:integrase
MKFAAHQVKMLSRWLPSRPKRARRASHQRRIQPSSSSLATPGHRRQLVRADVIAKTERHPASQIERQDPDRHQFLSDRVGLRANKEQAVQPRIRFHDRRHSAATLLGLGIHPKIVSEMLGHSQIAITLDLYSHVTATMQQEAVRAFEGLFGSQVGSQEGAAEHWNPSSRPCSSMDRATDF